MVAIPWGDRRTNPKLVFIGFKTAFSVAEVNVVHEQMKNRLAQIARDDYLVGNFSGAMRITDILRAEHTVFHHLFDHIETTAPRLKTLGEIKSVAVLVDKVMAPHAKTEDELFIEPLEHCFEQIGQRDTFHDEHEFIEETLNK